MGKRLMTIEIALKEHCADGMVGHPMRALEAAAAEVVIVETISVTMAMSDTTEMAESLWVQRLLDEVGAG